jgi:hypothetical protein
MSRMKAVRLFLLVIALTLAFVADALSLGNGSVIWVTTWNLEWFPNGSPKSVSCYVRMKH